MDINEAVQLALQYCQSGNFKEAESILKAILIYLPEDSEILYQLGVIYTELEQYDLAMQYINKSLQLNNNNAKAYVVLACVYHQKGYLEEASTHVLEAVKFRIDDWKMQRNMISILVTGTGRSGTGYMAKLLTSADLPCGHEEIIRIFANKEISRDNVKIGESSWLAVPFLSLSYFNETTIIHAVRNPLHTIQSLKRIKLFIEKDLYYLYVERFLPELKTLPPNKALFYFFIEWTKMILKYEDDERYIRHKVEDDPVPLINQLGGNPTALFINRQYNTSLTGKRLEELSPDDIPSEYRTEFLEISERIGYKLT
jgi:tetratricopeptide (TPR) repeat protein